MKLVIQRVSKAKVLVDGRVVGAIEKGLLLLVGFGQEDQSQQFAKITSKVLQMRLFPDADGRFDKSVLDVDGQILLVPQFTLFADTTRGRRPDFFSALKPEIARLQFERLLIEFARQAPDRIQSGQFGAHMQVELTNDGPVTILLDQKVE